MQESQVHRRATHLAGLLADANRQLLERDRDLLEILAGRDRELERARRQLELLSLELGRRDRDIVALNASLAELQATRAWRLACRYRALRDFVKKLLG